MQQDNPTSTHKPIQSFVRRSSRLTDGQRRAIEQHWSRWGLDKSQRFDAEQVFARQAPTWVEIGIGNASALLAMAAAHPEINFVGIEVHQPGIGRALSGIETLGLQNVRLYEDDAVEVLKQAFPEASIDRLLLFFPDPWHKKRHYKRRIVQDEFVALVADKLKEGGVWHIATDWANYAEWCIETLARSPVFTPDRPLEQQGQKPDYRPQTHFERRGENLGHGIADLLYRKVHACYLG